MANNPPLSSIGLILAVNSVVEKAMAATTSLDDLMARVRAISPSLSIHYVERHYNRAPDLSSIRRQEQSNKPSAR